jgi:hypothetical protein
MWCLVCYPIQLEHIDAQGKHKGLYELQQEPQHKCLKKLACHEHPNLFLKWGFLLL